MSDPPRSSFAELQYFIAAQVRQPRRLAELDGARDGAQRHLTGSQHLSPVETLEIYRRQFWLRHTSSLLEDFPGLSGILGQAEWEKLAESYLARVPPDSWTLRDLGKHLPDHVLARKDTPHHGLCVDMARLEWAHVEVFDAAEHPELDARKLASIEPHQWPTASFVLHPALRLLRTRYPVAELRRRLRRAQLGQTLDVRIPEPQPQDLVLYRAAERGLCSRVIAPAQMALLEALVEGRTLQSACERAVERVPDCGGTLGREVGSWFMDWGKRGWLVDVRA